MIKVIVWTFFGFILFSCGVVVGYIALLGVEKDGNMFLLIPSFFLMGGGIFVLLKAGRFDTFKPKIRSENVSKEGKSVLDKNNQIIEEWNKTEVNRDKLKILGAASNLEAKK